MTAPLVLLPGLSCTAEVWDGVRAALASRRPVLAPEHAALDHVDAIADAHLATLPERFALAGFSFGGYVALAIAARAPRRVERLALVSTGATADTPEGAAYRDKLVALARAGRMADVDARMTPALLHPANASNAAIAALRERMRAAYGVERYAAHQRAAATRPPRLGLLASLSMPALVATGREDRITPLALSHAMAERLPRARLHVFEDCGHLLPCEAAKSLAEAFDRWLDEPGDLP